MKRVNHQPVREGVEAVTHEPVMGINLGQALEGLISVKLWKQGGEKSKYWCVRIIDPYPSTFNIHQDL